jgi:hypothetical protein
MHGFEEHSPEGPFQRDTTSDRVRRIALFAFSFLLALGGCKKTPFAPDPENLTRPVIWLSSSELSFVAFTAGSNPASQVLKIKNSGHKNLSYTMSDDADWLRIDPANGSSSGQVVEHAISIDKANLSARGEPYSATITVVCAEAYNNPQKVSVSLQITTEPPPEIWVSPAELSFTAKLGTNPSPQTIRLKNTGKGTLSYTLTTDEAWLSVNPGSGTSGGEEKTHTVAIDTAGMGEGSYEGLITVADPKATNSPQNVKVTLNISKQPTPEIAVSPDQLMFQAYVGRNPSPQDLSIRNSGGGTLNYTVTKNAAWLSVNPTSGTSTDQANSHRVSISVGSLGAGVRQAIITVTDPKASNSPQQVDVTLDISPLPTDNKISISCNPDSGQINTIVTVPISITGNLSEIDVFGLDFAFDQNMFQYQGIAKGNLTGTWAAVDGNSIGPGTLRIGGFAGSGSLVPVGSVGSIAVITLKVVGVSYNDGYRSQLNVKTYTDDISGMTPEPALTYFTFRK